MSDAHRLQELRAANFRAKRGNACRVCKGKLENERYPYCLRHFRMLPFHMRAPVANGEGLEDADAIIDLRQQFARFQWVDSNTLLLGKNDSLHNMQGQWVERHRDDYGNETEVARYATIREARVKIIERRSMFTLRNRYASKALIR